MEVVDPLLRYCSAPGRLGLACERPAMYVLTDADGMNAFTCENPEHQLGAVRLMPRSEYHSDILAADAIKRLDSERGAEFGVPDTIGNVPIAFSAPINADGVVIISERPQVPFKGCRLVVPEGAHFLIMDLRVDNKSQLPTHMPVPAAAFAYQNVQFYNMRCEWAGPQVYITLHVRNISGVARMFRSALFGQLGEDS